MLPLPVGEGKGEGFTVQKMNTRDLYLDLLKRTLTFSLWDEPPYPIEPMLPALSPSRRVIYGNAARLLKTRNLALVSTRKVGDDKRKDGSQLWPPFAHTMVGMKRLDNLQMCVANVLADGVAGDLIETGVWRGGASIFMRALLKAYGDASRRVFVADSFAGLPPPDAEQFPADADDRHHEFNTMLAVSRTQVEQNFAAYGLLDERVVFLEGWFKDTLPNAPIDQLAILRLDGDMYESTIQVLETLYPKLASGGYCIIDDFGLPPCRQAVEDYRATHQIVDPIETVDWTGAFWRKTGG